MPSIYFICHCHFLFTRKAFSRKSDIIFKIGAVSNCDKLSLDSKMPHTIVSALQPHINIYCSGLQFLLLRKCTAYAQKIGSESYPQ